MNIRILLGLSIALLASCQHNRQPEQQPATRENRPDTSWADCYSYTSGKDTVVLELQRNGTSVSGRLLYNFYEKDRNTGTISGQIHGDTLIAAYSFMSEGVQSTREVAFLKNGSRLTEGIDQAARGSVPGRTHSYGFSGLILQTASDCAVFFMGK